MDSPFSYSPSGRGGTACRIKPTSGPENPVFERWNILANRYGQQFSFSMIKQTWKIYAKVTFGETGTPTLVQGVPAASPGVVSVTRNNTGLFTFVFGTQTGMLDVWPRFLMLTSNFLEADGEPAAPFVSVVSDSTATAGTCSMQVRMVNYSGSETDPASGEVGFFEFTFSNSTAS